MDVISSVEETAEHWEKKAKEAKASFEKPKKVFTKQNRRTVRIKNRFGLVGMASLMGIISVPAAVILVAKYFGKHKAVIPVLVLTAVGWSFAVTSISYLIYGLFVN